MTIYYIEGPACRQAGFTSSSKGVKMTVSGPLKISSWQAQYTPPAPPSSSPEDNFSTEEVVIKFKPGVEPDPGQLSSRYPSLSAIFNKYGIYAVKKLNSSSSGKNRQKAEALGLGSEYALKVPKGSDIPKIVAELKAAAEVEFAEPNYKVKTQATPDDPEFGSQWGLAKINAPAAWDINTGNGKVIAVIDTGIDRNHADVGPNVWVNPEENPIPNGLDDGPNGKIDDIRGWNFVSSNNNTIDNNSHGTRVAGIAGAVTDNAAGIAGMCWNVKLMPVRALDDTGVGNDTWTSAAIIYAADNGADIINLSYGGYYYSQLVKDAIDYAYASGCVIIASAGNDSTDAPMYPAALPHVIAVGATDQSDQRAGDSNFGGHIDLTAPGVDIISTVPGAATDTRSHTSYAAAFVSGLAALIKSQNPTFTNEDIIQTLLTTAHDLGTPGWDSDFGYGRIDALAALQAGAPLKSTITAPAEDSLAKGTININGNANGANFQSYTIEWGAGEFPLTWNTGGITLANGGTSAVTSGPLGTLDMSQVASYGYVTIKLSTISNTGKKYDYTMRIRNGAIIPGSVNDGLGTDIVYQTSAGTISANWSGFMDPLPSIANIAEYQYAIGTTPYGTNVAGFTSVGLNSNFTRAGLALASGTKYYVTVRAINSKGEYIDVSSNGMTVDTSAPAGTVNDGTGADIGQQSSTTALSANWNIIDAQSGIKEFAYSIGTTTGGTEVTAGWVNVGSATSFNLTGLNLIPGQIYYTNVRAVNNAGLTGTLSSDGVRIEVPPVVILPGPTIPRNFNAFIKPNPFVLSRGKAKIQVEMPVEGRLTVQIYSINNYRVAGLFSGEHKSAGIHEIEWDGTTSQGQKVSEGIYLGVVIVSDDGGKRLYTKIVKIAVTK